MELFATYTFGQGLLTVLEFALLFLWIAMAVTVVVDIFRSHDLSGWAKAGWIVLIVLLPLVGVLIYVIARGDNMKAHEQVQRARSRSQPITGAHPSPDDDVAELEVLRDRGVLSDEEFQHAKQRALAA